MANPGKKDKKNHQDGQSSIDRNSVRQYLNRQKNQPDVETLSKGILEGDRILLGLAITLVESENEEHQQLAQQILERCLPHAGHSIRIGITGSPGVGKSTFIEALGSYISAKSKRLAVLAIDPSSQVTHGSILGDKTRMTKLSVDPNAFIRPSPARTSLGGVARKTRETIILCEAAGFDTIIIETVGVGQSEMAVHAMVDFFLLLLIPGAGDELQGIKRGIVEMADLLVVNKADGERLAAAKLTKRQYQNALHLYPAKENNWSPKVLTCSALKQEGIDVIWQNILDYSLQMKENSFFDQKRRQQTKDWFYASIEGLLKERLLKNKNMQKKIKELELAVLSGARAPYHASLELIEAFFIS